MFLLMSAAYVGQDLKAEFGLIPPSMLPLGNRRLYEHQFHDVLDLDELKFITLPESYFVEESDNKWFRKNNIKILKIPDGTTLGESLSYSLKLIHAANPKVNEPLSILFGDTLITPQPRCVNVIHTAEKIDGYNWDSLFSSGKVITGYFSFSDVNFLKITLEEQGFDFIKTLISYGSTYKLNETSEGQWYDFGHVNRYYQSKANFTTERAFNELNITKDWVEKRSTNDIKIQAEASWFSVLPEDMKIFTPQFLGYKKNKSGNVSYRLEYLYNSALNELYVFGKLDFFIWNRIVDKCLDFIEACEEHQDEKMNSPLIDMLSLKTNNRIKEFLCDNEMSIDKVWNYNNDLDVSISEIIDKANHVLISERVYKSSLVHGDFCFSNILYDFRTDRIKTIDPRGLSFDNKLSTRGDIRYDLAKLGHSIIGLYDWIISGRFDLKVSRENSSINFYIDRNSTTSATQQYFTATVTNRFGITESVMIAMQIHLFLSMLPLHFDDKERQFALFSNAFRLYKKLLETCE